MKLVHPDEIPMGQDVPLDNLLDIYKTCQQMESLCRKKNGIGLSAVQVGLPLNLFIIKNEKNRFDYYINTVYKSSIKDLTVIHSLEGCLSIRTPSGQLRHFQVERYLYIILNGFRIDDSGSEIRLDQFHDWQPPLDLSVCFQHEIDHQFGKLVSHIGKEVFLF